MKQQLCADICQVGALQGRHTLTWRSATGHMQHP